MRLCVILKSAGKFRRKHSLGDCPVEVKKSLRACRLVGTPRVDPESAAPPFPRVSGRVPSESNSRHNIYDEEEIP